MDGILIINKQKGFTSHDVVNIIRKTLNIKKVGHAGTLDPNATGVLPILIGQGTKLSKYLIEHNKEYIATIKLGEETKTGDLEGEIIGKDKDILDILKSLDKQQLNYILTSFKGTQDQIPPKYSAIKINGKKAYEYARKGQEVELKSRKITIYDIKLIDFQGDEIVFKVECSKGTYIRSLCEDISKKLRYYRIYERINKNKD